jgi:hypothetical protein
VVVWSHGSLILLPIRKNNKDLNGFKCGGGGMHSIAFSGSVVPWEKSMTRNAKLQYPAAKPIGIDYLPVIDLHVTDGSDPEQRESCLHGRTKLLFEDQLESLKTRRNDLRGSDHQSD